MSNYRQSKQDAGESNPRDRWQNESIDWGRLFRGEPFTGPKERPLWYPMRAEGRYEFEPPEEIDADTGEVTTRAYWEKRTSKDGKSMWWPVEAHRRAESGRYKIYGAQEKSAARAAMERVIDSRVKD